MTCSDRRNNLSTDRTLSAKTDESIVYKHNIIITVSILYQCFAYSRYEYQLMFRFAERNIYYYKHIGLHII